MAQFLTLADAKAHLLVDSNVDDTYISALIDVAEKAVLVDVDQPAEVVAGWGGAPPAPVRQAMLLLVGNMYANREPVAIGAAANKVPYTFDYLKGLFKNYPLS